MQANDPLAGLTVAGAMTREVFAVAPDTALGAVAGLFAKLHITGAPVVDREGHATGVITLTDIVGPGPRRPAGQGKPLYYRITHEGLEPRSEDVGVRAGTVADVMSRFVLAVGPETPLREAIRLMMADRVHRLLVIKDGKLVGVLSSMDVLKAINLLPR